MAHPKIYKVGVRYKSTKRGIEGLAITGWFKGGGPSHCVIENSPIMPLWGSLVVLYNKFFRCVIGICCRLLPFCCVLSMGGLWLFMGGFAVNLPLKMGRKTFRATKRQYLATIQT